MLETIDQTRRKGQFPLDRIPPNAAPMSDIHLMILALIQGLTEFLPVSSSGHLILFPALTGAQDQGQLIDVAVHVGTLGAVILFFRRDVTSALFGTLDILRGRTGTPGAKLALLLIIATVPVVLAGLALKLSGLDAAMRETPKIAMTVIGTTMLVFGIVLWWADRIGQQSRVASDWTLRDAIVMGFWQAIALIPGTSRSGATITASRLLGYNRREGARLAMLMSIPTIIASGVLLGAETVSNGDLDGLGRAGYAALLAFFAALAALWLMMRLLRSVSFTPYVIYRIALGLFLLITAYRMP